jgi:enoyl-CoA hydratase/carnithine racemase
MTTDATSTTDLTNVRYAISDRVATITLNQPEHLNPITHGPGSMEDDVLTCLQRADLDDDVRCVVVTGAGRAFSSGGGAGGPGYPNGGNPATAENALDWYRFLGQHGDNLEVIRDLRKPVIGAINGMCYGAGLIMAAHFDFLVAAHSARFGLIETRFGATGVDVFTFLVGPQWAKFLAISGEIITAQKAKEIGLVLEVVPAEELSIRVADLARRVAAMPQDAVVLNRRLVNGTMKIMGWTATKELSRAVDAVTDSMSDRATSSDGRNFKQLRLQGDWEGYKEARDGPFREPWLR